MDKTNMIHSIKETKALLAQADELFQEATKHHLEALRLKRASKAFKAAAEARAAADCTYRAGEILNRQAALCWTVTKKVAWRGKARGLKSQSLPQDMLPWPLNSPVFHGGVGSAPRDDRGGQGSARPTTFEISVKVRLSKIRAMGGWRDYRANMELAAMEEV